MAAIKIDNFQGKTPRTSAELLPLSKAQVANNTKLYSGDLIPYRIPRQEAVVETPTSVLTIHGMRDDLGVIQWMSWGTDVDIILRTDIDDENEDYTQDRRFFYTGDGPPKTSWFDIAFEGAGPYPSASYLLGLPLPAAAPTVDVDPFVELSISTVARDNASLATIVTTTPHGLRNGNICSIAGLIGIYAGLNVDGIEITVVDNVTFTYYNRGDLIASAPGAAGKVNLSGGQSIRTYVYTWVTPFGEESVPSPISGDEYLREGQTLTVEDLPVVGPGPDYFVRGIRLYRTVVTANTSEYFRLRTLWFPISTTTVSRLANVVTVKTAEPHSLIVTDRFRLSGCADASFDADAAVSKVVDRYTFEFAQVGIDVAEQAEAAGTIYHDVAEFLTNPPRYWGDAGNFDFVDDFESRNLFATLDSAEYDPPPPGMRGLIMGPNNIALGFIGNQLCMSEPMVLNAWPERYRVTFEYDIVSVAVVMGTIIVLTEGYPYRVDGGYPDAMSHSRIDALFPCVSKRSAVAMDYGVVYASHSGLVSYSPNSGVFTVTKLIHDWDTWDRDVDFNEIVAGSYQNRYFASYKTGTFIYERSDQNEGTYVDAPTGFNAVWVDKLENTAYIIGNDSRAILEWDNNDYPFAVQEWKSKVYTTDDYINLGAARVIADYDGASYLEAIDTYNALVISDNIQTVLDLAALGIFSLGGYNSFGFNGSMFNGDDYLRHFYVDGVGTAVIFRLWADKELVFERLVTDKEIFRLPSGYRSDTYEVAVSSAIRIRAIHLAETPIGLKKI